MNQTSHPRALSLLFAIVLVAGCGIEEYYTGMGDGALPGDPLNPHKPLVTCDNASCECECSGGGGEPTCAAPALADLTGTSWRFDSIALGAPLPTDLATMVNEMFLEGEVEDDKLNVLLVVRTDDREGGQVVLDFGAGEVAGGGYAFFPGAAREMVAEICGTELRTLEPADLFLPIAALVPPELPLRNLAITGTVASGIADGEMRGALLAADADAITVLSQRFSSFLAEVPLDLDTDEDGVPDAWTFEGTFTAVEVTVE